MVRFAAIPLLAAALTGCLSSFTGFRIDESFTPASLKHGNLGVGGVVQAKESASAEQHLAWAEQFTEALDDEGNDFTMVPYATLAERLGDVLLTRARDEYRQGAISRSTLAAMRAQTPDVRYFAFGRIRADEFLKWRYGYQTDFSSYNKDDDDDDWQMYGPQRKKHKKRKPDSVQMKPSSTAIGGTSSASPGMAKAKPKNESRSKSQDSNNYNGAAASLELLTAIAAASQDSRGKHSVIRDGKKTFLVSAIARTVTMEIDVYDLRSARSVWSGWIKVRRTTNSEMAAGHASSPRFLNREIQESSPIDAPQFATQTNSSEYPDYPDPPDLRLMMGPVFDAVAEELPRSP